MVEGKIRIENARIIFRNFSGAPDKFNKDGGKRGFSVVIDEEFGRKLIDDGWTLKPLKPRDDTEEPKFHLPVKVAFGNFPPKIVMIKGKHKTNIDEGTVSLLDWADIKNVDLVLTPYNWEYAGRSGVTAYLKTMYVTIEEDEFEGKYDDFDNNDPDLPF